MLDTIIKFIGNGGQMNISGYNVQSNSEYTIQRNPGYSVQLF